MKKLLLPLGAAAVISVALLGCSQGSQNKPAVDDSARAQPEANAADGLSTTESPAPASAVAAAPVSELSLPVSDARVQNWPGIGAKENGVLKSNATNGYLMFGPKAAFNAGTYQVIINGNQMKIAPENAVTFDVTSDAGKTVHAKSVVDASAAAWTNGSPLARFEFTLPTAVSDLEVRAFVSSGSEVQISGYEIKPIQK